MPQSLMPSLSGWTFYLSLFLHPLSLSRAFQRPLYSPSVWTYMALFIFPFAKGSKTVPVCECSWKQPKLVLFTEVWGLVSPESPGHPSQRRTPRKGGEAWSGFMCPLSRVWFFYKSCKDSVCWRQGNRNTELGGRELSCSLNTIEEAAVTEHISLTVVSQSWATLCNKRREMIGCAWWESFLLSFTACVFSHKVTSCVPFILHNNIASQFMRPLLSNNVSSCVYEKQFHCCLVIT